MTEHIALVDTAIYPLDLISAAAYSMREDAVAILDSGKENTVMVSLFPKNGATPESPEKTLRSTLSQMARRRMQEQKNREFMDSLRRQTIPCAQEPKETGFEDKDFAELQRSLNELELEGLDDPLGISRPWGETGRKAQDRAHPHDE